MDFFGHQEQARRNTAILIFLFIVSVVLIVLAVYVAVVAGLVFGSTFSAPMYSDASMMSLVPDKFWNPRLFFAVTACTSLVILGGSFFKLRQLADGGGAAVAEMLGGERVPSETEGLLYRRLLNVVEEMAIASGLPVPPVYLLPQPGINAFAAGFTPSDAVIGVTQGAVEMLTRDELQGVIAHEFSHILNGDTLMKMRMLGLLHGITMVADIGMQIMFMRRMRRDFGGYQGGLHPFASTIGFLIFFVGTIGLVFADMIKRAVSREREFLADAAAVQLTRNPEGVAGALKVIGGYKQGSRINHVSAYQASHFFFGNAIRSFLNTDWWATHPPLGERIRRIEPAFKGKFEKISASLRLRDNSTEVYASSGNRPQTVSAERLKGSLGSVEQLKGSLGSVLEQIGQPTASHLTYAKKLIASIPSRLRDFAHDPYTARAAVYAMLLAEDAKQRRPQLELLQQAADPNVFRETLDIQPMMRELSSELRLPLVDIMVPALKELSRQQYEAFVKNVAVLIKSDQQISLFEYTLHRVLLTHLQATFGQAEPQPVKFRKSSQLRDECACVLAQLVRFGTHADRQAVFGQAIEAVLGEAYPMPEEKACRLSHFDKALRRLRLASPAIKKALLTACVECVLADGQLTIHEVEAMRAIADAMDCPMPPLLG